MCLGGNQRVKPRRDREAALGESDRRGDELRPWQPAMATLHGGEQAQGPWHPDRRTTDHRGVERERLPIRGQKAIGPRGRGCGLAPVPGVEASRFRVVIEQERAAAQP